MIIEFDGNFIKTDIDFHEHFAKVFHLHYYGHNLDALWDMLTGGVDPFVLIWKNSDVSREAMGDSFEKITSILERAKKYYYALNDQKDKFDFKLL